MHTHDPMNERSFHNPCELRTFHPPGSKVPTTSVLTASTSIYARRAGITAGAGTDTFPLLAFNDIFNLLPFRDEIGTTCLPPYFPSLPLLVVIG